MSATHTEHHVDFVLRLKGNPHVIDKIFSYCNLKDLENAELVSKGWNKAVSILSFWKKELQNEITRSSMWRQIFGRLIGGKSNGHMNSILNNKEIFCKVRKHVKTVEKNWVVGDCSSIKEKRIVIQDVLLPRNEERSKRNNVILTMDDHSILVGFKWTGAIKVYNRRTLAHEMDFPLYEPRLNILQLHEDMIFTSSGGSGSNGTVRLLDRKTGELLSSLKIQKGEEKVSFLVTRKDVIVAWLLPAPEAREYLDFMIQMNTGTIQSRISIWKKGENEFKEVYEQTLVGVFLEVLSYEGYLIVFPTNLRGSSHSTNMEFRSIYNYDLLFTMPFDGFTDCDLRVGFGLVVAVTKTQIRLLDIENKASRDLTDLEKFIPHDGVAAFGFNSKYLIARLRNGPVLVYDWVAAMENQKARSSSILTMDYTRRFVCGTLMDDVGLVDFRVERLSIDDYSDEDDYYEDESIDKEFSDDESSSEDLENATKKSSLDHGGKRNDQNHHAVEAMGSGDENRKEKCQENLESNKEESDSDWSDVDDDEMVVYNIHLVARDFSALTLEN